jgi:hypothetical protein
MRTSVAFERLLSPGPVQSLYRRPVCQRSSRLYRETVTYLSDERPVHHVRSAFATSESEATLGAPSRAARAEAQTIPHRAFRSLPQRNRQVICMKRDSAAQG